MWKVNVSCKFVLLDINHLRILPLSTSCLFMVESRAAEHGRLQTYSKHLKFRCKWPLVRVGRFPAVSKRPVESDSCHPSRSSDQFRCGYGPLFHCGDSHAIMLNEIDDGPPSELILILKFPIEPLEGNSIKIIKTREKETFF